MVCHRGVVTVLMIAAEFFFLAFICGQGQPVQSPNKDKENSSSYLAAAYQHAVHNWFLPNITRLQAVGLMNKNLDVYERQIQIASSKGVSIIVFPEYGITGLEVSPRNVDHFVEFVPNPYLRQVNPCTDAELAHSSPTLHRLSCLAREHSIVLVANLVTVTEPCGTSLPSASVCPGPSPGSGRRRYNTDVALGSDGQLLAKYDKESLYGEELLMFEPGKGPENLALFSVEGVGVFGLFTCFDMLFEEPARTLTAGLGVANMVFPTGWMNELPLLSGVEYQEAWALRFDVNLLAANLQLPLALMTGGGLFAGGAGAVMYHHDMTDFHGTLLIGRLPTRAPKPPEVGSKAFKVLRDHLRGLPQSDRLRISPIVRAILEDATRKPPSDDPSANRDPPLQTPGLFPSSPLMEKSTFVSSMNHDPYTFILLTLKVGRVSVCSGTLCCHLNYTFRPGPFPHGTFALGVFNGLHTNNGQYYIQTCALVRCRFDTPESCGAQTVQSDTRMASFSLSMEGQDPGTTLFPSLLTSDVRLAIVGQDWRTRFPFDRIWSDDGPEGALLVASLFGRCYAKDGI